MYNETVKSDWFFVWLLFHLHVTEAQAVPVTMCPATSSPMTNLCTTHKFFSPSLE